MNIPIHMIVIAAIFGIYITSERWWLLLFLILYFLLRKQKWIHISTIWILITFLIFIVYSKAFQHFHDTTLSPQITNVTGEITTIPQIDGNRVTFHFELPSKETILVEHKINTIEEQQDLKKLHINDVCAIGGHLDKPMEQRNFYSFNYKKYLKDTYHIHWIFYASPTSKLNVQCQAQTGSFSTLLRYRQVTMQSIKQEFPKEIAPIMNTLIFGDRTDVDEELQRSYQSLGLIHLLAISGLHVGTILGILYFLLIRMGVVREYALVCLLIFIPCFIVLTGGAPSVIRAGLMASFVCISVLFKLKIPVIDQLSYIALALLLYKPTYVFHIGFQLSFLITASLIISNTYLLKGKGPFVQLLIGSTIAQVASLPIVIWNFHAFSLWSLPLNMLYIPIMTLFLLPVVMITFFLYQFAPIPLWEIPAQLLSISFGYIHEWMQFVDSWAFGKISIGRPSDGLILFMIVSLFVFIMWIEKRQTMKRLICSVVGIFLMFALLVHYPKLDSTTYVTYLDVGQGDASIIELPFREAVYVIDTGGDLTFPKQEWMKRKTDFNTGDVVASYLKARGINHVDALILSHGDFDHVGGTLRLLQQVNVDRVIYGKTEDLSDSERHLLDQVEKLEVPISWIEKVIDWRVGKANFKLIPSDGSEYERNNRSIVLHMDVYNKRFLFTGDIEKEREDEFIRTQPYLKGDFLKVAHHGSETSSSDAFLNQIKPKTVIISAAENNRYGHPSEIVMEKFRTRKVTIYETARHGGIRISIAPKRTNVETTR